MYEVKRQFGVTVSPLRSVDSALRHKSNCIIRSMSTDNVILVLMGGGGGYGGNWGWWMLWGLGEVMV